MQVIVRVRDQPVSELWGGAKIGPYYYNGGILLLLYSWQQSQQLSYQNNQDLRIISGPLVSFFYYLTRATHEVFFHIQVSQTKDSALSSLLRGEVTSVKSYGMSPCDRSYIFSLILGLVSFVFHSDTHTPCSLTLMPVFIHTSQRRPRMVP